jgi:alpha-L-fucosidase
MRRKRNPIDRIVILAACLAAAPALARAADKPAAETPAQRDARMGWFRDARFGLFIHWGVYSVPAGSWQGNTGYGEWFLEETKMPVSQYEQFAKTFNPVKFDAKEWVRIAKDAGMKYIVITSKHHDGFGMFRSDLTDWCIKSTPFDRDPLKELADACKDAGITMCFYHSIMDWHHPDWGVRRKWNDKASGEPDMDRFTAYLKGQLKELLTRYGPIGILWFDGQWEDAWTTERGHELYGYVRGLQPQIIVNNRVGKGDVGDYGTPEQTIPARGFGPGVDWESCMTMNNHWGFNAADQNWKSTQTIIRNLVDCASKGGNYLLNVGPTSEGLIPSPSIERLAEVGTWMKANGASVYGTTASPFAKLAWGRCTQKPGKLYLHVFDWPKDGRLVVPLTSKVNKAYVLARQGDVLTTVVESPESGVVVRVPSEAPDARDTVVVLEIEGTPTVIETGALTQAADGSFTLPAAEAVTHGETIKVEGETGRENLGFWIDPGDWVGWPIAVTKPGTFKVTAEVAAIGSTRFELGVGDHKLTGTAPDTGQYTAYRTVELGTIELPASKKATLVVKPVREHWRPFNLRSIRLTPSR